VDGVNDVIGFEEVPPAADRLVGGKGARLAELSHLAGVRVPPGFCVTTGAFRRMLAAAPAVGPLLDRLAGVDAGDASAVADVSAALRQAVVDAPVPDDLVTEVGRALDQLGPGVAVAVRSSATDEDLPTASAAGQQDSFLDVVGPEAVVHHLRRCWASVFNEGAVAYRLRLGIDHRAVGMAVVVQVMVAAEAAGVLFTADPVTSDRRVVTVEAVPGLGDALVSGRVEPDRAAVRDGDIVSRTVAAGPADRGEGSVLTDAQLLELAALGRRIEAFFDRPQDVEWCLAGGGFQIVQARPITTLFPVPESDDDEFHVYVSVGHQQMMTDAMRPLGLDVWLRTTPRAMAVAGGRLFVDVAPLLRAPTTRAGVLAAFTRSDPLIGGALQDVVERDLLGPPPEGDPPATPPGVPVPGAAPDLLEADADLVTALIDRSEASIADLAAAIAPLRGTELVQFIGADILELRRALFVPENMQVITAAAEASRWLNEHLEEWLGESNAADVLTRSAPHDVTAAMGLALLDVADVARTRPAVVALLEGMAPSSPGGPGDGGLLERLGEVEGGPEVRDALIDFLDAYGMRCVGEIDVTRTRWAERPEALVPLLLADVRNFDPGERLRRFEAGRREAEEETRRVLERVAGLPDGAARAEETARMIDRVRTFSGYREYPKYAMVSRYFLYKQALRAEAGRLVEAGVLGEADDVWYLSLDELEAAQRSGRVDRGLVERRRRDYRASRALTPPRVLTSDGEVVTGAYRHGALPDGALPGLAVSSGLVEGRARVLADMGDGRLEPGDILVTSFTDPSWTPAFVVVAGLVTEVGGLMTHGAVIAREYGLPAVVGVEGATRLIRDGARIRVHGTEGWVELLD